jgi:putative endonuclease
MGTRGAPFLSRLYRAADDIRHRIRLRRENPAQAWGKRGEDLAHRFLQSQGYTIVARNYRTRTGTAECDLVARYNGLLVFVEVKTRATDRYGAPELAVDRDKRHHVVRAAADYLLRTGGNWDEARFDIVSVLFADGERIQHHVDAFRPEPQPAAYNAVT